MMNQNTTSTIATQTEFKVNNTEKRIRTAQLIEIMEERQSRRFDQYTSFGALYESVRQGELTLTPNATNQFFSKINLDKNLATRLTPGVWDSVIQELAAEADSKNKTNGLVRYEKGLDGKVYVRAVLSKDYALLDTLPMIKAAQSIIGDNIIIRDYIDDDISVRLSLIIGDPISLGTIDGKQDIYFNILSFGNSETGNQSYTGNLGLWRMWCLNGAMNQVNVLGNDKVRHYGAGKTDLLTGDIKSLNPAKLIEANVGIVEMYKNSKGIYIPVHEVDNIMDSYVETADLPKKMVESAKTLHTLKYKSDTMFDIYNSVTEAIHRQTQSVHTRFERESAAYKATSKIVDAVLAGKKIDEAIPKVTKSTRRSK